MSEFTPKDLLFYKDARDKLLRGAKVVHDAVGATMGPGGQLAIYQHPDELYPVTTKDGVSVARMICLADPVEDKGAMMIIQAANKQVMETGDGTTLTCVLAYKIFKEGARMLEAGFNLSKLLNGIDLAVRYVTNNLRDQSIEVGPEQIKHIATISTNNDHELGELISEAVIKVGKHGVVLYNKSDNDKHTIEYEDGYRWDSGIAFREFATNGHKMMHEQPYILVTDHIIQYGDELVPIVRQIKDCQGEGSKQRALIIICPEIRGDAFVAMVHNIVENKFISVWIRPGGGLGTQERKYSLADIAAITGATYLSTESGIRMKDVKLEHLGTCKDFYSDPTQTLIREGAGEISKRVQYLQDLKETIIDPLEKQYINTSIAKLLGGVATIRVGGRTASEQKEILDRVDDAVKACRSAEAEGIVPGGGVAMLISKRILDSANRGNGSVGYRLLIDLLTYPAETILTNARRDDWQSIINDILRGKANGYEIDGDTITDTMIEKGIVDPTKVIVKGLENAASVAKLMLQSAVTISDTKGK